jgi:prophage regulatory protein
MIRLMRLNELTSVTGLKRSAIYARIRVGDFPPPVLIGQRAVAWRESEVETWISDRPTKKCTRVHESS